MKTADLTGALLDYWTARAEGVPAAELEIRQAARPGDPRSPDEFCVRLMYYRNSEACAGIRIDYSTNWSMGGPLIKKYSLWLSDDADVGVFYASKAPHMNEAIQEGDTPLIAICRAVVRAAFGDEVEDLP